METKVILWPMMGNRNFIEVLVFNRSLCSTWKPPYCSLSSKSKVSVRASVLR